MSKTIVSVIVPIYNEEKYISNFLESVISQDFPVENMEVILIDGMSSDKTREIINIYAKKYSYIRLIDNHRRTVQHALNIGIENSIGEYIVRLDAHSEYSKNYISKCIEYLKKTGATNVGGPVVTASRNRIQNIIAESYYSEFALGGGKNHDKNYEGYTDTVFLGAFKRDDIVKIGMYDSNLIRNEDDDLCFRMIENNMKIYMTPEIKSKYYPRDNLKDLFKQYFEYGFWKVAVIKKHKKPARITHLVPVCFVIFLILFGILSLFSKFVSSIFVSVMGLYLILNLYFSFKNKKLNICDKFILMLVHFILHVSYGLGFLVGILNLKKSPRKISYINLDSEKLKKIQQKSLDILKYFKEFCEEHNLKFYVCGGGCIGAIRHQGFIPWDDDLDVFMPREDYDKLEILWKNHADTQKYSCLRASKNLFTGNIFTTIIDNNTTVVRPNQKNLDIPQGLCLDVLPLDGCAPAGIKRKIQKIYALIYSLFCSRYVPEKHGKIIYYISKILLLLPNKLKIKIWKYCEKQMSKYKICDSEKITELCSGPKYMQNEYPKEIFQDPVYKKFENLSIPLPSNYDLYLKMAFGDYMKIPDLENQKPHHDIIFMDLENSYKTHKKEIENL